MGDIVTQRDSELIPHSNVRRVTAQRLTESKQQIPHYYLTMEMNVDNVLALRERVGKVSRCIESTLSRRRFDSSVRFRFRFVSAFVCHHLHARTHATVES